MIDLRIFSGPLMFVLGAGFLFLAGRLWWVRPLNRVFRLGPYVTELGMRAVLNLRFPLFAIGAFLTTQGITGTVFWWLRDRDVNDPLVQALGALAGFLGGWAVGVGIYSLVNFWRGK